MADTLRNCARGALRLWPWSLLLLLLAGCARSEPFEVRLADLQEKKLWRAGIETYAPDEYSDYQRRLRSAKDALIQTEQRFVWFRDYDAIARQFKEVIDRGEEIFAGIGDLRARKKSAFAERLAAQRDRIDRLDTLTTVISVGRSSREFLVKAGLFADEAEALAGRDLYDEADERLKRAATFSQIARDVVAPALKRFVDQDQIASWRRKVDATIGESRERGDYAIVVSKVDRQLFLYKAGRLIRTYSVGLGAHSIRDKAYAGDRATPEGTYRITKKLAKSRYYKALLINYPNEENQRQFALAKRRGQIPRRAGIGGLIEIHGGGKDGLTYGCVALDDHHMEELYALADVNTPVTIVGARDYENSVSQALKGL